MNQVQAARSSEIGRLPTWLISLRAQKEGLWLGTAGAHPEAPPGAEESLPRRHTAIRSEGRVLLHLKNGPEEPHVVSVPKHKKHPPAGVKATTRTRVSMPAPRLLETLQGS